MNPSSLSTWAMLALSLVAFISAAGRSIEFALRIRVSMSAIGSVIMAVSSEFRVSSFEFPAPAPVFRLGTRNPKLETGSPARLADARDHPVGRQVAETNAADAE